MKDKGQPILVSNLYRGDKRKHGTLAELYRTDGLLSKVIKGGNPKYISQHGLYKAVCAHVNPNISEKAFHDTSLFISFSSDYNRALHFASNGEPDKLQPCEEYSEQRYLIDLDVSSAVLSDGKKGLYKLVYNCNRKLIKPNSPSDWALVGLRDIKCPICEISKTPHSILLIDVVTFLTNNMVDQKREGALESAIRDSEWLVLPTDYVYELRGFSARLPRADIWTVKHFVLSDDEKRYECDDAVPGMIFGNS